MGQMGQMSQTWQMGQIGHNAMNIYQMTQPAAMAPMNSMGSMAPTAGHFGSMKGVGKGMGKYSFPRPQGLGPDGDNNWRRRPSDSIAVPQKAEASEMYISRAAMSGSLTKAGLAKTGQPASSTERFALKDSLLLRTLELLRAELVCGVGIGVVQ